MSNKNCPCTYKGCDLKGNCEACVDYHRDNKELPACYFDKETEKTYDRSIKRFIQSYSK